MKLLAPRAVWLFFVNTFFFFLILYFAFSFFGFMFTFVMLNVAGAGGVSAFITSIIFEFLKIVFVIFVSYGWAVLTYRNYKYELRPEGFRKEHGVIWKKYTTIPYERIQNVDIYRGIIARILGLSDLHIQTAGMSSTVGSYGAGAEGRLPGLTIEDAEALRDELIKRAKGQQGL